MEPTRRILSYARAGRRRRGAPTETWRLIVVGVAALLLVVLAVKAGVGLVQLGRGTQATKVVVLNLPAAPFAAASGEYDAMLRIVDADPRQLHAESGGETLLHIVVQEGGPPEVVQALLDRGADPLAVFNAQLHPNDGQTPVHYALRRAGSPDGREVALILLSRTEVREQVAAELEDRQSLIWQFDRSAEARMLLEEAIARQRQ